MIPAFARLPFRALKTYISRIGYWIECVRELSGETVKDSLILWLSFLSSPVTSLIDLRKWRDPMALWNVSVLVPRVGRFNVRAGSDDLFHVLPSRERAIFDVVGSMLKPGDCFVDAGANIGFYSMLAAKRVGSTGRVIAIEMMPDTAAILRHHVHINGGDKIEVVEMALLDRAGGLVTAHVTEGKFGQASISGALRASEASNTTAVHVKATTLDVVLKNVPAIRLMKMDLEGVEAAALKGAEQSLKKIQALIFECLTEEVEIARFLAARGFSVNRMDGRNSLAIRR